MKAIKKIITIKHNDNKELDISTKQGHSMYVESENEDSLIVAIKESNQSHLKVLLNGHTLYENYNEAIRKYNKKLWPLLKTIKWEIGSNDDMYFYNQYGRDISIYVKENEDISFRLDYVHIPNVKESYPKITDKELQELINIDEIIQNTCKENGYYFNFSHFMENTPDENCWSDVIIPKDKPLNLDVLNYLFYLGDKMEKAINTLYNKHKR